MTPLLTTSSFVSLAAEKQGGLDVLKVRGGPRVGVGGGQRSGTGTDL